MSNILLYIGAAFFALGANIIFGYIRFLLHGKVVRGRVKAIEKYISITRSTDNSRYRATMYCAHVEYQFEGATRIVKSISTNQLRHRLQQPLKVLLLEQGDGTTQARVNDLMNIFLGAVFALVGLMAVAVYLYNEQDDYLLAAIVLTGLTLAGALLTPIFGFFKIPVRSGEDVQHPRKDAILIQTDAEFEKELQSVSRAGFIIAWAGILLGLGMLFWGYSSTTGYGFSPGELKAMLLDIGGLIDLVSSGELHPKWHKPLILIGMGGLFTVGCVYSLIMQKYKYGFLGRP